MSIEGYIDYQRREYCKDIKCPIQMELDKQPPDSNEYEQTRQKCKSACIKSTYEFHHWLIGKGYLIIRPTQEV